MSATILQTPRSLVAAAVRAGRFGAPLDPALARDIDAGAELALDSLGLDSLGWMEFCISIELDSGLELAPSMVAEMETLADVERWIAARLPG